MLRRVKERETLLRNMSDEMQLAHQRSSGVVNGVYR
jgi:hypothetical protein